MNYYRGTWRDQNQDFCTCLVLDGLEKKIPSTFLLYEFQNLLRTLSSEFSGTVLFHSRCNLLTIASESLKLKIFVFMMNKKKVNRENLKKKITEFFQDFKAMIDY